MEKETRNNIRKELQELGSQLEGHSGQAGFGVPEGYFDRLPQAVQQRISAGRQHQTRRVPAFALGRLVPVIASIALLIAVAFSFFLLQTGTENGYLTHTDESVYEEYFALVSEYDRSLLLEFASQQADAEGLPSFREGFLPDAGMYSEDDHVVEYFLDMADYYGFNTSDLIAGLD
jgi:hypothetical protein